jgi:hypothetical protein
MKRLDVITTEMQSPARTRMHRRIAIAAGFALLCPIKAHCETIPSSIGAPNYVYAEPTGYLDAPSQRFGYSSGVEVPEPTNAGVVGYCLKCVIASLRCRR